MNETRKTRDTEQQLSDAITAFADTIHPAPDAYRTAHREWHRRGATPVPTMRKRSDTRATPLLSQAVNRYRPENTPRESQRSTSDSRLAQWLMMVVSTDAMSSPVTSRERKS